jgi:hypothetical protein
MKVSLKEAYSHARTALPSHTVQVEVHIGNTWDSNNDGKIVWHIAARKDNESSYSSHEVFAVALANLTVEIKGKAMKPVEDMHVEQGEQINVQEPVSAIKPEGSIKPEDIPF